MVSMYLPPKGAFFPQRSVFILRHGVPSVPCIVGALFDVLFSFFNMTEYQFVLGIPVSSRIQ